MKASRHFNGIPDWVACVSLGCSLTFGSDAQIVLGQTEDFSSGPGGWGGGSAPSIIPNGGRLGAGDSFLQIVGSGPPNGNLGTRNSTGWSGDFLTAGVTGIAFDLNLESGEPVSLRIMVQGPGGDFTTTQPFSLLPGGGWVTHTFSLQASDLTSVGGIGNLAATLSNMDTLLLRHDGGTPSGRGEASAILATLGIDNITAVPEPPGTLPIGVGLAVALVVMRALHRDPGTGRWLGGRG